MRTWMGLGFVALGAFVAACSTEPGGPTSPSAANGTLAAGADGSTLKVAGPRLVAPSTGATVTTTPNLVVEPITGRYATLVVDTARFQVSDNETFSGLTDEGVATASAATGGLINYRVQRAQATGTVEAAEATAGREVRGMTYLLGIDVGTSACKAALFDEAGTAVRQVA